MNDDEFAAVRAEIDLEIDDTADSQVGITMGFGLCGEFLIRNLLTLTFVNIGGLNWDMRTYRDRFVYPNPTMADLDFALVRASGA